MVCLLVLLLALSALCRFAVLSHGCLLALCLPFPPQHTAQPTTGSQGFFTKMGFQWLDPPACQEGLKECFEPGDEPGGEDEMY